MNASFGIDHPLIATHDIEGLRSRLISLGFNMTAIGKHPWGTSTSQAMFEGCLIEIMGIYDDSLLDALPTGEFRFGRHVYEHLRNREGVALTALHSTDSAGDAARAEAAGYTVAGHLEFGRDVTLPDGQQGRTRTTLALLPDLKWPRLSFFLCQQHRPELIHVSEWLEHPNTVCGICGLTIYAEAVDHAALKKKLNGLYPELKLIDGGFQFQSANGPMRVRTKSAIEAEFGPLSEDIVRERKPSVVAMDLKYKDVNSLQQCISDSGLGYSANEGTLQITEPEVMGNLFLRFTASR